MEYNNYYPAQSGLPPPPSHMQPNHPHGGGYSQIQLMPGANSMMVGTGPPPPQAMRQVITPGPPPGHQQQMQPQQPPPPQSQQQPPPPMMGGHQHMQSPQQQQHQQHPGYHHPPPLHPHPHTLPHSGSPHPNQQQQQPSINMNLQPPSRPSTGPSPHHPMHQQSPHLIGGPPPPPMHVGQQQQPPQQHNHVGGPPSMPPTINQPQPGMQQHPHQNFMSPGPAPPPTHPSPHYNQPPPPLPAPVQHSQAPPSILPMHHHHHGPPQGPPPPQTYLPHQPHVHQPPIERASPFYQNIPQTEFRIIELNKRLQNRPRPRGPAHPLPQMDSTGESYWWEKFACDFFDNDSTLTFRTLPDDKPVEYTIGRTLIPRFFKSYFDGGVVDLSIKLRSTRETVNHHLITLDCDQTDITTKNVFKYRDMPMNVVVHTEGHLSLEFVSNSFDTLLIKSWRFYTHQCREYIDRSMTTATGLPPTLLIEPVTRYGLTKQTMFYLKMCMIMEPMQELMLQHRQTQMDPRACLKKLLFDKYKLKSTDDNRAQPNRRRKRKTPATTGLTKKAKANANNANAMNNNNNSIGFSNINNSLMSSPTMHGGNGGSSGPVSASSGVVPNLSLASQDVMVVGEPSMLGADFGDENERRITRLENNQFDSSVNNNSNNNNGNNNSNNISQMCNNAMNQNPNSSNNMNHMQPQQNNHDTGSIQMMNHMNSNNNNNNNNGNTNNKSSDPNKSNNNGNSCLQSGNNHQQMNLITMNGNINHMSHMIKQDIDLKQSSATPTTVDMEQTR